MRTRLPVRFKLAVVTAALTFGILCIFAVVIGAVAEQRIRAGFDDDLRASVANVVNRLDVHRNADGVIKYNPAALSGAGVAGAEVRLVSRDGEVEYPPGLFPLAPIGYEGLSDFQGLRVASRSLAVSNRSLPDALGAPLTDDSLATVAGYVQYAKPLATVNHTVNRVRLFLAFGVLGGTLLAFLGGLYVAERAMRPIAGLTRAAREVARTRDPDITLPKPRANDEVSDLATTFEAMLRELGAARQETEATLDRQRAFVADASHELRTPLTTIAGYTELARRRPDDQGAVRTALVKVEEESARMTSMVEDLLLLARLDAGRPLARDTVDLSRLLVEAVSDARVVAPDHRWRLELPEESIEVTGDAERLHQVLTNLLTNASKHTPPGTTVTVTGTPAPGFTVHDDGPGFPPELATTAFERFVRGDVSRTRSAPTATDTGGAGLGLSLVHAIVSAHGGRVTLDSHPSTTTITVTLPG
jgi:two-component system, OmpR family, sensor kinase